MRKRSFSDIVDLIPSEPLPAGYEILTVGATPYGPIVYARKKPNPFKKFFRKKK